MHQPAQHLRDEERQLQRLLRVQPRVAGGLVAVGQVDVLDLLGAAEALGDVLAGELDVDAARVGAQRAVHLEEAEHLVDDPVEVPGLVAVGRLVGVAVHRVALPHDLVAAGGRPSRRSAAATSRTLPLPIRLISVSRPGTLSGLSFSHSSMACSGVVVGPSLTPIGLAIARRSRCARRRAGGCARRSTGSAPTGRTPRPVAVRRAAAPGRTRGAAPRGRRRARRCAAPRRRCRRPA